MKEQYYQSKIIKKLKSIGGIVVNGTYTQTGIADLICGYPIEMDMPITEYREVGVSTYFKQKTILLHLHIEVKTQDEYEFLMRKHITEEEGLYVVNPDYNGREVLQAHKLNEVRQKGGLALFAYDFKQVEEYIDANK
jgi:hypothetical protein